MAGRGGARPGAGRPKLPPLAPGDKAKRFMEQRKAMIAAGMKPLDVLLYGMQYFMNEVARAQQGTDAVKIREALMDASAFAEKAAPYTHQRLATITTKQVPYDYSRLTDAELATMERLARKAAGPGGDGAGAPATSH